MRAGARTRVLVVGADAAADGWGARAHIPAVLAHPALELEAICTSRPETAKNAAAHWGARRWFADFEEAVADPGVDLVTVAVRVGLHDPIVRAAAAAGKPVYCEWPLGLSAEEASELAAAADGVPTAVGLQGRFSPAVQYARELLDRRALGRPLTFAVTQTLARFPVPSGREWLAHEHEGSGALNVATGHALDIVEYLLGPVDGIAGASATLAPADVFSDTGESFTWTAADTVAATVGVVSGAVGTVYVTYLADPPGGFVFDIFCDEGRISLRAPGYVSYTPCVLRVARRDATFRTAAVPRHLRDGVLDAEPGANVARALAAFADTAQARTPFRPNFDDAARLHGVLEKIRCSELTPLVS
jgi:predicted dehydrogenase